MGKDKNDLSITKFEEKHLETLNKITETMKRKKELDRQEKDLKKAIMEAMDENAIYKLDTGDLSITLVEESESQRIDLKAMKEQDPELYEIIEQEYTRTTKRAKQLRVKVREDK